MKTTTETEITTELYVSFNNWHTKFRVLRDGRELAVLYLDPSATKRLGGFIAKLNPAVADED